MEASFSRRKLVTPEELKALNVRSNLWGASQMASHISAILCVGYIHTIVLGTAWALLTGFLLGILLNFLYGRSMSLVIRQFFQLVRSMRYLDG